MNETRVNWWMDASSHWHRGRPPAAWWQAEDGRWHPPGDDDPTVEMVDGPPAGAAHLAGDPRSPSDVDGWGWPRWARIAVLPALAVLAAVVVGAAAITDGGRDDGQDTVTAETTSTLAPGTTAASPTPTAEPPLTTSDDDSTSSSEVADAPASPSTEPAPTTTTDAPPTTTPPPSNAAVSPGAGCSPEGATALTQDGVPMTCTTQKCHGAPFDTARWRRTAC